MNVCGCHNATKSHRKWVAYYLMAQRVGSREIAYALGIHLRRVRHEPYVAIPWMLSSGLDGAP